MEILEQQWIAYHLHHKDHCNLSLEEVAKEMSTTVLAVKNLLKHMKENNPELFTGTSGRERDVLQYGNWYDEHVKMKF